MSALAKLRGWLAPTGFPFVTSVGALTDCETTPGCTLGKTTAILSQPQEGTVCLKGTVEVRTD